MALPGTSSTAASLRSHRERAPEICHAFPKILARVAIRKKSQIRDRKSIGFAIGKGLLEFPNTVNLQNTYDESLELLPEKG
jgi:hypothetical protein